MIYETDDSLKEMKDFIMITESLLEAEYGVPEMIVEKTVQRDTQANLISDMNDLVFKLRAFMESSDGDIGLGIEMGMQRAADMIENVLNRYVDGD